MNQITLQTQPTIPKTLNSTFSLYHTEMIQYNDKRFHKCRSNININETEIGMG